MTIETFLLILSQHGIIMTWQQVVDLSKECNGLWEAIQLLLNFY